MAEGVAEAECALRPRPSLFQGLDLWPTRSTGHIFDALREANHILANAPKRFQLLQHG